MSPEPTLDALLRHPPLSRRARPPNMTLHDDTAVPLRPDQLERRESRLGIRGLFRKGPKDPESPEQTKTSRSATRSTGIRASLVDMSNWSYGQQPVRPDVKEPLPYISKPLSTPIEHPTTIEEVQARAQMKPRGGKQFAKPQHRGGLVAWDAPPLFKAYPQAIKHSTLPASILSPDAILRMRAKRLGDVTGDQPLSPVPGVPSDNEADKPRKKKGWNAASPEIVSEWTTKIYILVTSGCLLQYSSEGSFDRLPEKVLQLGKASAAFASDVIPGRHWVLQVSSALEADGSAAADQKSLFSRLPFRVAERRQASNFLMVFESADDMESWLATLRREIEALGGKKALSETGKPKADEPAVGLREQPSQRTLVLRDPARYSKTYSADTTWQYSSEAGDYEALAEASTREQSLDGTSATNSVASQDGRHLDSLRDSSHRLSVISSSQRTVVTSEASSSPSSSPTRDSFPSPSEEERYLGEHPNGSETRLRPNASAIVHRRRSLQTFAPIVGGRDALQGAAGLSSTMHSPLIPETAVSPSSSVTPVTPNFSVPHSSNRRFSYMRTLPEHITPLAPPPRPAVRKLPTPLEFACPLPMVKDQPSPNGEIPERPATRHGDGTSSQSFVLEPVPTSRRGSFTLPDSSGRPLVAKRSSLLPREVSSPFEMKPQPRRLASMATLRPHEELRSQTRRDSWGARQSTTHESQPPLPNNPSIDGDGNRSPPSCHITKRSSMFPVMLDRNSRHNRRSEIPLPLAAECLPEPSAPPTAPLPPLPSTAPSNKHLQTVRASQLLSRRSLPQLVEGPPPAPPPSCALPPIPQRPSVKA
ncbi:hypothetical protein NLU13_0558 [Sarocladium strictum]|uniref:PH domain-containing protein n=1 Tax=Sarocladium strictum TaxID=5046 RepID=A0AA39GPK5_SARSR|nr:hypothetical protein NLU13_0558 [Sarocladium strictum]